MSEQMDEKGGSDLMAALYFKFIKLAYCLKPSTAPN
jgi:hypothetical protein